MRNSAVPSGFVSPPPATQGAPQTPVSPDQLTELLQRLERKLTGEGAGRIAGMTLPLTYNKVGFSPDEMALDKLLSYYESRICAALRVPPMLLGLSSGEDTKTYSNYGECIEDFWRRTIIPMQDRHGSEIESQVFPLFGLDRKEYRLTWDRSQIAALQEDLAAKNGIIDKSYTSGTIDLHTAQVERGIADVPEEYKGRFHPSATAGDPQAEPVTPEEAAQQERLNRAAKSTFIKVIDGNGVSHDELGLFDGGSGGSSSGIEVNLPTQHPNMLKGDGMPKGKIPDITLGDNQKGTVKNVIAHLRDVWAKPGIFEKGVVVTKDNNIIQSQTKKRESTSVKLSEDQMDGAVLLHSHPIDLPPGSGDIQSFISNPIQKTIIVSSKHSYELSKPEGWKNRWKGSSFHDVFASLLQKKLVEKGYTKKEAATILADAADGNYRGELLSKNAKEAQLETVKETAQIMGLQFAVSRSQ